MLHRLSHTLTLQEGLQRVNNFTYRRTMRSVRRPALLGQVPHRVWHSMPWTGFPRWSGWTTTTQHVKQHLYVVRHLVIGMGARVQL
jgi:hypothetical protein